MAVIAVFVAATAIVTFVFRPELFGLAVAFLVDRFLRFCAGPLLLLVLVVAAFWLIAGQWAWKVWRWGTGKGGKEKK